MGICYKAAGTPWIMKNLLSFLVCGLILSVAGGCAMFRGSPTVFPAQDSDLTVAYRLRVGDPLTVQLRGIPREQSFEFNVDEDGRISLPFIGAIEAAGKTASQLQRDIERAYLDQQIYRQITAVVLIPAQSYFMRGEVRQPGRYPKTAGLTILQAIASAGGYTEYANPRRVNLIRDGRTTRHNARQIERNPDVDIELEAGDIIIVPRSIF